MTAFPANPPGLLVTADGEVFRGRSVGVEGVATGEAVFNTSMTGYQEIITDASYAGQVVVMTMPHQGNYGVAAADDQRERSALAGFVMRSLSRRHSNWRAEGSLAAYLQDQGVVALADVDTRRLTRHIREGGAMPAAVGSGVDEAELRWRAAEAPGMLGQDLVSRVTTSRTYTVAAPDQRGRVVAVDLGMKRDIITQLTSRGYEVVVVPAGTPAEEILGHDPDGVFLSNGPGDPQPLVTTTSTVARLLGQTPVFGICLGHQVLGLALGASTFKLPFGHHGGNHPVRRLADGRVDVTAHNHGFAVDLWSLSEAEAPERRAGLVGPEALPGRVETPFGPVLSTHQNLNDGTLEGLRAPDAGAFSVQYHPEAAPGPHDAVYLFDELVELMEH